MKERNREGKGNVEKRVRERDKRERKKEREGIDTKKISREGIEKE